MGHYFGLSSLSREDILEEQCERLFDIDVEGGQEVIRGLVEEVLSRDRHWSDGYVYEAVLTILVDILAFKEKCVERLVGFIRDVDIDDVGSVVMELEEEWASVLNVYFNPSVIFSDFEEDFDADDVEIERQKEERKR
ncbi:hypothetical protein SUGI_0599500 [Cryptomeria japonica]|nr:hypothetical protein SUGI_0599500 [Cryptomeria japonica]